MTDFSTSRLALHKHRSNEERRRIVESTFKQGASITQIARKHGIHPTSLSHWRSLYRAGMLCSDASDVTVPPKPTFVPVALTQEQEVDAHLVPTHPSSEPQRHIVQLTFSSGATFRLETASLDTTLLRALVSQVQS